MSRYRRRPRDRSCDEGEYHFTYSLFPHEGDWTEAGVGREAFDLNSPLLAVGVVRPFEVLTLRIGLRGAG